MTVNLYEVICITSEVITKTKHLLFEIDWKIDCWFNFLHFTLQGLPGNEGSPGPKGLLVRKKT